MWLPWRDAAKLHVVADGNKKETTMIATLYGSAEMTPLDATTVWVLYRFMAWLSTTGWKLHSTKKTITTAYISIIYAVLQSCIRCHNSGEQHWDIKLQTSHQISAESVNICAILCSAGWQTRIVDWSRIFTGTTSATRPSFIARHGRIVRFVTKPLFTPCVLRS